jgi:hypothetical protein
MRDMTLRQWSHITHVTRDYSRKGKILESRNRGISDSKNPNTPYGSKLTQ